MASHGAAQATDDTVAARAQAALAAELPAMPLEPEHRIITHYDLARFWIIHGERGCAFAQWIESHRLLGRFQPFSRDGRLSGGS